MELQEVTKIHEIFVILHKEKFYKRSDNYSEIYIDMDVENEYTRYIDDIKVRKSGENSPYCKIEWQTNKKIFRCIDRDTEIHIMCLDLCEVGDGPVYEHLVLDAIGKILGDLVDHEEVLMHVAAQGGYYDIEFAFCTEMLPKYEFWRAWHDEYKIKSIIIEAKNEQKEVGPSAARQIWDYIENAKKGHFGLLVSKNGFTMAALTNLCFYAKDKGTLILPITHEDLKVLLRLSMRGPFHVYRFFRIKETRLLRVNR